MHEHIENIFLAAFFFPAAAAVQTEMAAALSSFGPALAEIKSRLATVEKILKDVE